MGSDHGVGHLPICGQHLGISHARRWLFEVGVLFFRAATKVANTWISPGSRRGTGVTVGSIIWLLIFVFWRVPFKPSGWPSVGKSCAVVARRRWAHHRTLHNSPSL
eukprot:2540603-Pyramimonas_sp.AAC.1